MNLLFHRYQNLYLSLTITAVFILFGVLAITTNLTPGINQDTAWNALYALEINETKLKEVYTVEQGGKETLYHNTLAFVFNLLGVHQEAIEITGLFFAGLSIPIFFYLANKILSGNKSLAITATLLWVASPPLLTMSLSGWRLITLIPLVLVVMYFGYTYQENRNHWSGLALGITAGIMLYTYNAGRAIFLFFPLFWLVILWVNRRELRSRFKDALLSCCAFLITITPMIYFAFSNWSEWNYRMLLLQNGYRSQNILTAVLQTWGVFSINAHGNDFYTTGPLLLGPEKLLWIAGSIIAITQFSKYWLFILLFWVMLAPSILSIPSYHRAIGALPIIYIFIVILFKELHAWSKTKDLPKHAFKFFITAIMILSITTSIYDLFILQRPFQVGFYPYTTAVGEEIKSLYPHETVIYAQNWAANTLTFSSLPQYNSNAQWYKNYQSYNTPSNDGLSELLSDLSQKNITSGAYFVVEHTKKEQFVEGMKSLGYETFHTKPINYQDKIIGHIYTLQP